MAPLVDVLSLRPQIPRPALRAGKGGQGSAPHPAHFCAERDPLRGSRVSPKIANRTQVEGMGEPLVFDQLSLEM